MIHLVPLRKALHISPKMRLGHYQIQTRVKPYHHLTYKEGNREVYPSKDTSFEFSYGQVKSQVETLTKKIHIIEGSST